MTPPLPLSQRLRAATRSLHTAAERAGPMPALLRGELPLRGYVALLQQLSPIYSALESALHTTPARAGTPGFDPALARGAALQADLAYLQARTGGLQLPQITPAASAYAAHLQTLPPPLLAAHAYVRYLGDLAGGQVLARIVGRAYGLQHEGLCFYRFAGDPVALSQGLRAVLDALPADEGDAIVAEAIAAFQRHVQLFDALAETPA